MTSSSPIAERTIGDYLSTLASPAPTPGGGSVSGLLGALAAALGQMVANVSARGNDDLVFANQVETLQSRRDAFVAGSEADEAAYGGYVAATSLPKATAEEKALRREALQESLHQAVLAPLAIMSNAASLLAELVPVIESGGKHILSDAEIAILMAVATVDAGMVNVRVNLPLIKDAQLVASLTERMVTYETLARSGAERCRDALANRQSR